MANRKQLGLAVVGCGVVGRMRATLASEFPGIGWIGLSDMNEEVGNNLKADIGADLFTTDWRELIARPEVDATIIATSTWAHTEPTLAAIERGHKLMIEKPLATDARESAQVLDAIEKAGVDAVVGYTQRFRRRFLVVKERITTGQVGEATAVVVRAFMNRMAPTGETRLTQDRRYLTPMVVSGTHSLDMAMWLLGDQGKPASIFARSSDRVLKDELGITDTTFGLFTMEDGTLFSMNISWGLPKVWPGAVYGLEIGIVGTQGVIDIEDTHRDMILASEHNQGPAYRPKNLPLEAERSVDFLTSFPPGDIYDGDLWGPMREETNSWFNRIYSDKRTPHATAADGHRNLMLTMAMDLSAKRQQELKLPISPDELMKGLEA